MIKKYRCVTDENITYYAGDIKEIAEKANGLIEDKEHTNPNCQTGNFEKKAKAWDIKSSNTCGLYVNPSLNGYFCVEHRPIEKIRELLENGRIIEVNEAEQ